MIFNNKGQRLITGKMIVIVLLIFVLATVAYGGTRSSEGFLDRFRNLPGFGDDSKLITGPAIVRYDITNGEVKWYDGVAWQEFYDDKDKKKIVKFAGVEETLVDSDLKGKFYGFWHDNNRDEFISIPETSEQIRVGELFFESKGIFIKGLPDNLKSYVLFNHASGKVVYSYAVDLNGKIHRRNYLESKFKKIGSLTKSIDGSYRIKLYPNANKGFSDIDNFVVFQGDLYDGDFNPKDKLILFNEKIIRILDFFNMDAKFITYGDWSLKIKFGIVGGEVHQNVDDSEYFLIKNTNYNDREKLFKDLVESWRNSVLKKPISIANKNYCVKLDSGKYLFVDLNKPMTEDKCEVGSV